jgi:hypothetical protein
MDPSESAQKKFIRTVTAPYKSRTDSEMNIISILYGAGLILILLPLIPFALILWLFSKIKILSSSISGSK